MTQRQGTISAETSAGRTGGVALPSDLLDTLASRIRGGGLFLAMLDRDGVAVYHDASAAAFFTRMAWPLLQSPGAAQEQFASALGAVTASSGTAVWQFLPGVLAAVFPHVDKRQVCGIVVVLGRREGFALDEDVLREAGRMGLDAAWLEQQAKLLRGHSELSILTAANVVAVMARDQVRLKASEQEIDSLSTQLANSYEELSLIYRMSSGMKVNRSASDFFKQACLDVRDVMSVQAMGVALCGEGACRQEPVLYGESNVPPEQVNRLADQLMAVLRDRQSPLLVNDLASDKRFSWFAGYAGQLIAVPLQRQDQVPGCLFGLDKFHADFDSVDSKLLNSIANESAIYLENAMLFEDVHDLMMGVLHSLTSAVDAKDPYTCGHSERVALLSRRLAREMGISEPQVERIYMAGILHDVGKIGVPEAVLHKTGKLTAEEYEQMKKHPAIGARILTDIKQVQDLIPGVLYHHERYDGKGYPARLSGENIPLMGRIICIADCFDAMTSNRTYRRALPLEVAMIELRRCAGTQFDPVLAEAFLRIGAVEVRALLSEHQARVPQPAAPPEGAGAIGQKS